MICFWMMDTDDDDKLVEPVAAGAYEESDTQIRRRGWLSRFYKNLDDGKTLWKLVTGLTMMRFLMLLMDDDEVG